LIERVAQRESDDFIVFEDPCEESKSFGDIFHVTIVYLELYLSINSQGLSFNNSIPMSGCMSRMSAWGKKGK
jgi:hypothetical protein